MKYALPATVLLVISLFLALLAAPWLADRIAEQVIEQRGYGYGSAYGYGYGYDSGYADPTAARSWPVGSFALIIAFVAFAALGGAIMALGAMVEPPPPPAPGAATRAAVKREIGLVKRRNDLTAEEKRDYKASAEAIANAEDHISLEAARRIGEGDSVVAAQYLASEARDELIERFDHAAAIAAPFSDSEARQIAEERANYARFDELAKAYKDKLAAEKKAEEEAKKAAERARRDEEDRERLKAIIDEERRNAARLMAELRALTQGDGGSNGTAKPEKLAGRGTFEMAWDDEDN